MGWRARAGNAALAGVTVLIVSAGLRDVPGAATFGQPLRPVQALVGLDQDWRIFAPEPRRASLRMEAVVEWSDGKQTVWKPPSGSRSVGAYRDYRWRKWLEQVSRDSEGRRLWPALARFVVRTLPVRVGARPLRLRLLRYARPTRRPGEHAGRAPWQVSEVYEARLTTRSP